MQELDIAQRRAAAAQFASTLRDAPDIHAVWLVADHPGLVLAVVMNDVSLDRELELRARFAEATTGHPAELEIYDESGSFDFEVEGEQLG